MRGFILKDLYIMRKRLISIAAGLAVWASFIYLAGMKIKPYFNDGRLTAFLVSLLLFLLSFSVMTDNLLVTDERRKWNAYASASEAGVAAVVGAKYTLCFIFCFVMYLLGRINDMIVSLLYAQNVNFSFIYLGMVFYLIITMSVELFAGLRFGAKYAATIRIFFFVAIVIAAAIYGLFGDIEWFMGEGGVAAKMQYMIRHADNEAIKGALAKLSGGVISLLCLIPHGVVAGYYISYRLSCRSYTKGAENYDK
ncbi:MAG: ABC-2 transporter permease [Lachnospiraceae bacterium]|nr:ABC-2 transporter permease [Lachnospiraceae bacterium]